MNNVGLVRPAKLGAVDLDDLATVFDVNVRVAVQATQAVLPGMLAQGWGRIVNISSLVTVGMAERTPTDPPRPHSSSAPAHGRASSPKPA